jgi:hypothetical protein
MMELKAISLKVDLSKVQEKFGNDCVVTAFRDGSGAIVVVAMRSDQQSNAFLVDSNGERQVDVQLPQMLKGGLGFADAYYVNNELTAIYVYSGRDFACVIDEKTGSIDRCYETR